MGASSLPEPLWEDAALAAFAKPAGLLTIPGRREGESCLFALAQQALGQRLFIVHRIDRETSGLVLFARTASAHRTLCLSFERREVEKRYLALVAPPPAAPEGLLEADLVPARRGFMRLGRHGERSVRAVTLYRRLRDAGEGRTLLEVTPRTGRTHQIRLQLAELGSPLVGEPHYRSSAGVRPQEGERLWLHAWRLALAHPMTGAPLALEAPPPSELRP